MFKAKIEVYQFKEVRKMVWTILSWVMSAIALAGTILNAERSVYGFIFWVVSNLYMAIRFLVIGEYAQMTLFLIYFVLALRGISVWSKKEKNENKTKEKVDKMKKYIDGYFEEHNL